MSKLKSRIKLLFTLILGGFIGVGIAEVVDYLKGQPVQEVREQVKKNYLEARNHQNQLLVELDKLKSLANIPPSATQVINNISTISSSLNVSIDSLHHYSDTASEQLLRVIEFEKNAQINSQADFVLPLNRGTSLCNDNNTFSIIHENNTRSQIRGRLRGHVAYFNVGSEYDFEVGDKNGMVSYLGKVGSLFAFRLVCDTAAS